MGDPISVHVSEQIWSLLAAGPAGPIAVSGYGGGGVRTTALAALDLSGTVLWRHEFDAYRYRARIGERGTIWLAYLAGAGSTLTEYDLDGAVLRTIAPEREDKEHLGAFVRLPDGFCLAWLPAAPGRNVPPGRMPRVVRYTDSGAIVWSTALTFDRISFPGVVEMGVHTGWEIQPMKPWTPKTMEMGYRDSLLVSGDRVLVAVADSSGIGVCTLLDLATGDRIAATEPAPYHYKAIAGPGEFLVGSQGYGAFECTRYNRDGVAVQQWPSHAMFLVDRHGTIGGPESENILPSRSRYRVLNADGSLTDGPPLSGYYTTYPALDRDGTAVFWRDGKLLTVDAALRERVLYARDDRGAVLSRTLLLDHGRVVFAIAGELLIVTDTGLAPLDTGPWPCGDGNLQGNPVAFQ